VYDSLTRVSNIFIRDIIIPVPTRITHHGVITYILILQFFTTS